MVAIYVHCGFAVGCGFYRYCCGLCFYSGLLMRCMLFACVVLLVNCLLGVLGCGLLIAFCGFGFDDCAGCMFVGCVWGVLRCCLGWLGC